MALQADNPVISGVFEIAALMLGLATLTLLLNPKSNTVAVIRQSGETYNQLLNTLTGGNFGGGGF